jgi:6-phosphogluconolactonase
MNQAQITVLPDAEALAVEAAQRLVEIAHDAIRLSGTFTLTLSGGSTPKALYELLAGDFYRKQVEWEHVEIFFGDERSVPPVDPQSNYHTAWEAMLSKLPIPPENIHRMRGEIDPNEAAIEYGRMLKERFGEDGGPDLVLLGMGDDGHTASLFPDTEALKESRHRCVANFVPKLNTWRITMTVPFLKRARVVMMLVAGKSKAAVVQEGFESGAVKYPVQMIDPINGKIFWLLDVDAAGMAEEE